MSRPDALAVADRSLILYALTRRGAIELVVNESGGDPARLRQADAARQEQDRWLRVHSLADRLSEVEATLLGAESGSWPREAVADAMWRKESLGVLLWALQHVAALPGFGHEFAQHDLDDAITRYGDVDQFRANGTLRPDEEVETAWQEASTWFAATEGATSGADATLASVAAERLRALRWLRGGAEPV